MSIEAPWCPGAAAWSARAGRPARARWRSWAGSPWSCAALLVNRSAGVVRQRVTERRQRTGCR